jgi:hypothetical protein
VAAPCSLRKGRAPVALFAVNRGSGASDVSGWWLQPVVAAIYPGGDCRLPRAPKSPRLTVLRCGCGRERCSQPGHCLGFTAKAATGATL